MHLKWADGITRKYHPEVQGFSGELKDYECFIAASAPMPIQTGTMLEWLEVNPGKPFGTYGISVNHMIFPDDYEALQHATFIYPRSTAHLDDALYGGSGTPEDPGKNALVLLENPPLTGFGPDCVYAFDMADHARAEAFLASKDLTPGEFLAVVPILRKTPRGLWLENGPYYEYTDNRQSAMEANRQTMDHDFGILRDVIIRWVRETGWKVLLCPEMTYSIDCFDELIIDQLPDDVKPFVEKRAKEDGAHADGFWYADEALAVYERAFAMVSMDNHSPIMAVNRGVPMLFPSPRTGGKEIMWRDIGLDDWFWYGVDDLPNGEPVADKLMEIYNDYPAAKVKVKKARELVRTQYLHTIGEIRESMGLPYVADTDGDGIADVWEHYHYGGTTQCDPSADTQKNGMTALMEFALDAPLDFPDAVQTAATTQRRETRDGAEWLVLRWRKNQSAPHLKYQVCQAPNLDSENWEPVEIDGVHATQTLIDPDPDGDNSAELWETAVKLDGDPTQLFLHVEVKNNPTPAET
jgi:hypothetical protein